MNFLTKNIRIISVSVFAAVIILVFILSQCGKPTEHTIFCFDTLAQISLSGKNSDDASAAIQSELFEMDRKYNKYSSSDITSFNGLNPGEEFILSDDMAELLKFCLDISRKTDGAFDITTSKLSDLWQIKTTATPPSDDRIKSVLSSTGYDKITLNGNKITKTDADIDFGGVLKGAAADRVRKIADEHGVTSGIINLGGNVCLIGSKNGNPWTVGVANPFSPSDIYLTVEAENTNVITSGAYQRYFEYNGKIYHHILSPETGYPVDNDLASVTVISPNGTLADCLSTAIFVQGSKKGLETAKTLGVEVIMIKKDGSVIATDDVKYNLRD